MKRKVVISFILNVLICGSLYAANSSIIFKPIIIAQTGMSMPGVSNKFFNLGAPDLSKGRVVFQGSDSLGFVGIFSDIGGILQLVAGKGNTKVPGSDKSFYSFGTAAIFADQVAFLGKDSDSSMASIYSYKDGQLSIVVGAKTVIPGTTNDHFSLLSNPIVMSNGNIAFIGQDQQMTLGIYAIDASGKITTLVSTNTSIPNGKGKFTDILTSSFSRVENFPNDFAFVGVGSNGQIGIYIMHNNKLELAVNQQSSIPGGVGPFSQFDKISYDGKSGSVAFVGNGVLGQTGIYVFDGKHIVKAIDQESVIPEELDKFKEFFNPTLENNLILFRATDHSGHEGIYLFSKVGCFKIISTLDKLNNKTIKSLCLGNVALTGDVAALRIMFNNGDSVIMVGRLIYKS